MKKLFKFFMCAICAISLFSCQKEIETPCDPTDENVPEGYIRLTLKATSESTKTTIDAGATKWAAEDKIKVICDDGTVSDPFELEDGVGETIGDFTGFIPDGKTALHAVYPASSFSAVSGTTVKVIIPDEQTGVFGAGNIAVANVAGDHSMAFKNVNAFISFTVPAGITKVIITSVGGGKLSGTVPVDCSGAPTAGEVEGGGDSITTTFPENTGGTYYVSIVPGVAHAKGLLFSYYKGADPAGTYYLNKNITAVVTASNNMIGRGDVEAEGNYYVTVSGTAANNGMSWETAMSASKMWKMIHIDSQIASSDEQTKEAKLAAINGATFHLAAGNYAWGALANTGTPTINIDETDAVSFTVKGGYNASTGARDIVNNATVFTGDDDADGTGDHQVLLLGGNMNVVFDGIRVEKGYVGTTTADSNGAGVNISGGSWTFTDCSFSDNIVLSTDTSRDSNTGGYGGAIAITSGNMTINGGSFTNNMAWRGGAIWQNSTGTVTITGASFTGNGSRTTTRGGGAVYVERSTTFNNCTMDGNEALWGGAMHIVSNGTVAHINGGTYQNNLAGKGGGVFDVDANTRLLVGRYESASTYFLNNTAESGNGGAILFETKKDDSDHANTIDWAVFTGNQASNYGGACYVENTTAQLNLRACTFNGCHAAEGGAIYFNCPGTLNITTTSSTGCVFQGNYSTNYGGAIRIKAGAVSEGVSNLRVQIWRAKFTGNYSKTGGVWYSSSKPDVFIDRCYFADNYFTDKYGIFTSDGANHLCFNNCSFKGNYTTNSNSTYQVNQYPSWFCIDDMQSGGVFSISNSTIIGDVQYSGDGGTNFTALTDGTALVRLWDDGQINYFTNNIIVPENASIAAIKGQAASVAVDLFYNHTGAVSNVTSTDNGGNVNGLTKASLDNLAWHSSGYWSWDGTFGGIAPTTTNYSAVDTRINSISTNFRTWLGSDIKKDGRGTTRSDDSWWPGAYQN